MALARSISATMVMASPGGHFKWAAQRPSPIATKTKCPTREVIDEGFWLDTKEDQQ